ncbi:hypothetical protein MSAN_00304200 [Mycena sanguinolenta]|uniref:Uncharacterized protein n=1 Tax=Mycena sanguinolenta TaxID=230812 RepID=A0A8H6ZB09_9AGAR|nr:hypothetical protein MSAN_00304200 [Mycena sanguinolenta]
MAVWHPNIVQLYGTASFGNIHAVVLHDDLIPFEQFLDLYEHSHLLTVYIHVFARIEFEEVSEYFSTMFLHHLSKYDCTFFIRRSTGRLCLDLVPSNTFPIGETALGSIPTQQGLEFLAGEVSEDTVIDSLTLHQYHEISYWELSVFQNLPLSTPATVSLGSVFNCSSDDTFDDMVEIACLPNAKLSYDPTWNGLGSWSCFGELMADGWTRFSSLKSNDLVDGLARVGFYMLGDRLWPSQANHIFTTLKISSDFQNYVVVDGVDFELTISTTEADIPSGFLFLCAPKYFQTAPSSFRWPECPAYWSLDPSGTKRLTLEEATSLGFPSFQLSTKLMAFSWDASVYAGIGQFHQAKGFNPDSQDVARHLDHKLYQVSGPFAYIDDQDAESISEGDGTSDREDTSDGQDIIRDLTEEELVDSTVTYSVVATDVTSIDQDKEEIPLSNTFKFVLNVQLSLIFFSALFWVLSDM